MENLDLRVLADALAWRQQGHAVTLATLLETWGTSPRPPGALLAFRGDGQFSGSSAGGYAEDDLIARTRAALQLEARSDLPSEIIHALTQDEAESQGLPCGGNLRLVQEPVTDAGWIAELLQRTEAHQKVARTLTLATGAVQLREGEAACTERFTFDGLTLTHCLGPRWRVVVIGASQLGQAVAGIARQLDMEVLVCDPRTGYGAERDGPGITRLPGTPEQAMAAAAPDQHTAVLALSHEPALDDPGLYVALQSPAFYIGALGSQRNQTLRKQRMTDRYGSTEAELARLVGPAGLKLGGKTASEMALSIVAQLVQVKNGLATVS